jgi:hypothetical protein
MVLYGMLYYFTVYTVVCRLLRIKSISTNAQYVTQRWKSWMRFIIEVQCIHWNMPWSLKTHAELSEPSHEHRQITFIDCSLFLIGPSGLLLVVPTYLQSQFQFYGWN